MSQSFGRDVGRFGLFVSLYFSSFRISEQLISFWRRGRKDRWNALFAGALASVSLLIMEQDESFRWTLGQYLAMRAAQCLYNHLIRARPNWKGFFYYGDVGLFSFASAQLMYGYFVRPETLDSDYRKFVERFAGVDEHLIAVNRDVVKASRVHLHDLLIIALSVKQNVLQETFINDIQLNSIPCSLLHHESDHCLQRIVSLWWQTLRGATPMYFSLHLIPSLLFKMNQFLKE